MFNNFSIKLNSVKKFLSDPTCRSYQYLKLYFKSRKTNSLCSVFLCNMLQRKYLIHFDNHTIIGENLFLPHPQNIIIGKDVKIGNNCTIYQNVTLGQNKGCYPTIGNNVTIYTGAVVIGDIFVGDNAIIGANSVIIHDVPPSAVVAGVPGKVIRYIQ